MKQDAQQKFEAHCREELDIKYHLPLAQQAYKDAYQAEPVEVKKENAAMRAMNQYLYKQLKLKGEENWRGDEEPEKKKPKIKTGKLTDDERKAIGAKSDKMPDKYNGKILRDAGLS